MKTLLSFVAALALMAGTTLADAQCDSAKKAACSGEKKAACDLTKAGKAADGTTDVPASPLAGHDSATKEDCAKACAEACAKACADACAKTCDKSAVAADVPLNKLYGNLMKKVGEGCKSSGEALTAAKGILGVCCASEGTAALANLEDSAKNGCNKSQEKLAKLVTLLRGDKPVDTFANLPMSGKVEKLLAASTNGCDKASKAIAALMENCGSGCNKSLAEKVKYLEECAANGCAKSQESLVQMETKLKSMTQAKVDEATTTDAAPLSMRLKKLMASADGGCKVSSEMAARLKKDCETQCLMSLAEEVKQLEEWAGNGCHSSKERLAKIEAAMIQ